MAINDSFSDSVSTSSNDQGFFKALTQSVSDGFAEGRAGLVRDEITQIKKFYKNTLDLQKQLQKVTGKELPLQIQSMMQTAISGFDNILDQKVEVNSDQAQATFALVDKIADAKMGSEIIPVMSQLKKISDRQNLQTIANQNAQERMQITSMALGQSMSSFVAENIDAVSNSELGQDLAKSLPVALAGPFGPLVSAMDDLVDFKGIGGRLKQGTADAFNRMFNKSVADGEDEAQELMDTISAGDMAHEASLGELNDSQSKVVAILDDMKNITEDAASDKFFADNIAADRQAMFREQLLERLDSLAKLSEDQIDAIADIDGTGGFAAAVPIPSVPNSRRPNIPFGAAGATAVGSSLGSRLGAAAAAAKNKVTSTAKKVKSATPAKLIGGLAALAGLSGFVQAVEKIGELDVDEVEKKGGFFQAVLLQTMDNLTGGITTRLSDGLSELIETNNVARAITDPIFGAIHGIANFATGMMDDPLKALEKAGDDLENFFSSLYEDHLKDPLDKAFDKVGSFVSGIWEQHIVHPFEFAMKQIRKFIDDINPFSKSADEKTFDRLVESGILVDNTFGFGDSKIDFNKLRKQAATEDELRFIRNKLGGDLSEAQESRLSALILKSSKKPNTRESVERMPRVGENSEIKELQKQVSDLTNALSKQANGSTVAVTAPSKDELRVHNDNATIDIVNLATQ